MWSGSHRRRRGPLDYALLLLGAYLAMKAFHPDGMPAPASPHIAAEGLRLAMAWVVAGTLAVLGWLAASWWLAGRDPSAGAIAPHWEPPENVTPAEAHFLDAIARRKAPDAHRAFTATLLSLALRGYIAMRRIAGQPVLERVRPDDNALSLDEKLLLDGLFGKKEYIILSPENADIVKEQKEEMSDILNSRIENMYMEKNRLSFHAILILATLTEAALILFDIKSVASTGFRVLFLHILFMMAAAGLAFYASRFALFAMRILGRKTASDFHIVLTAVLVFMALFLVNAFMTSGFGAIPATWHLMFFLGMVVVPAAVVAAWYLLPRPSARARRLLDKLEGLRMFIRATERKYLARTPAPGAPEDQVMSEAWYRRLLPWAIALGVERQWTNAFRGWLLSVDTGLGANRSHEALPEIGFGLENGGFAPGRAGGQNAGGHGMEPGTAHAPVPGDGVQEQIVRQARAP